MSRRENPFRERAVPSVPGEGFRFLLVGELRRTGDEFYSMILSRWTPSQSAGVVVTEGQRNRYRRAIK